MQEALATFFDELAQTEKRIAEFLPSPPTKAVLPIPGSPPNTSALSEAVKESLTGRKLALTADHGALNRGD